jgi:hypothetical protein
MAGRDAFPLVAMWIAAVACAWGAMRVDAVRITAVHHAGRAYEMAGRVREAREVVDLMRRARPASWPTRVIVDWSEADAPDGRNSSATIRIAVGSVWTDGTDSDPTDT